MNGQTLELTGWTNGSESFEFSIARRDRDRVFGPLRDQIDERRYISVEVPGEDSVRVTVTPSFWKGCPEFRSRKFGAWLKQRGHYPWPRGRPPKYIGQLLTGALGSGGSPTLRVCDQH